MSLAFSVMSSAISEGYLCFSFRLDHGEDFIPETGGIHFLHFLASSVMYLCFSFRLDHGEDFIRDTEGIRVFSSVQCDVFCSE